jgi:hypothetical protein
MSKTRTRKVGAGEGYDKYEDLAVEYAFDPDLDDYEPYKEPYRHQGRKLRHRNIPYSYQVDEDMLHEGLNYKLPIGLLKPIPGRMGGEDLEFKNVKYAGGYRWNEPLMRDQLGVDCMALGPRVFSAPGTSFLS